MCNPKGEELTEEKKRLCFFEVKTYFYPEWQNCNKNRDLDCVSGTYKLYLRYEVIPLKSKYFRLLKTIKSPVFFLSMSSLNNIHSDKSKCNEGLVGWI